MIIVLKPQSTKQMVDNFVDSLQKNYDVKVNEWVGTQSTVLGLIGDTSAIDIDYISAQDIVESIKRVQEPYKKANRKFHPDDTVITLPGGQKIGDGSLSLIAGPCSVESERQIVEIAKAVSYDSKIIVFDEPTSSLTETEVEHLFRIINMLRDKGCGIIYISHKMEEILRISDDVTIMRDGQWVATRPAKELTMDEIIRLMVGRELTNRFPPKTNKPGEVYLEVEHLTGLYNNLRDVSFTARRGEIVGLAGLDGSGRTETLETMFGVATRKSGRILLDGKECKNLNPRQSIKNNFALLTEERRATGIFGILDIRENSVISSLDRHKRAGFVLSDKSMRKDTQWSIDAMHTKTPTQETKIRSLSGGNQQKVIIGRWLLTAPDVLLLDEQTRGIDVGAKYEIYQLILDLANKGKTVIMVSSEMPELLGVCDRILVMSGGRLAGEVDAKTATQEDIMRLAAKYV